jgi:ubiquinone/menaquinone biosynthesis C-methylase UbiE
MSNAVSETEQIIQANRDFYHQIAPKYDRYETCVTDTLYQQGLEQDLDNIAVSFTGRGIVPDCLDCGGGTGNLALKLLKRNWNVTVVDVSPDMLAILESKIGAAGYQAEIVHDSLEHFFSTCKKQFDFIGFYSVLHHLHSPSDILLKAIRHVTPGGFLYTNCDPAPPRWPQGANWVCSLDTLLTKIARDPNDLLPGAMRRLRKKFSQVNPEHNRPVCSPGDIAEYHAYTGVDDFEFMRVLQREGFQIHHTRYPIGRTSMARWLNRRARLFFNFKIVARRSATHTAST